MSEVTSPEAAVGATLVEALYFRSLRYVSQPLGPFHILVGPNASGKSNFLDVLAFLGDMLSTDLPTAVLGDDRWSIPYRAADGRDLLWSGQRELKSREKHDSLELAVEMAIPAKLCGLVPGSRTVCRYEIEIDVSREPKLVAETFWMKPSSRLAVPSRGLRQAFPQPANPPLQLALKPSQKTPKDWRKVVSRGHQPQQVMFRDETSRWTSPFRIDAQRSALANLPADRHRFPTATWFRDVLQGAQRIVLSGEVMRKPCPPVRRHDYLPDGSNLPHVVHRLAKSHPDRHERWIKHVREALPDIIGITTREREEDRHRYLVLQHSNAQETPSWLVSDGTLRLLALTLLAYLPDLKGIYLIEEPENGLHPLAVETVLQSLSSVYDAQILLTTHSPLVARLAEPDELLCLARDETAGTDMVKGTEHPRLREWQGSADLGTLLASGVLG